MLLALALYPGSTALDIVGPFQVLVDVPGHDVVYVASARGEVFDHTGRCPLIATASYDEVARPDVVVVPGGYSAELDHATVEWLRKVHPTTTWTSSVCTGSIYLAAAGILTEDATTHWARAARLEDFGARYTEKRVVRHGKVITAAGASSGIDMALALLDAMYGPEIAQGVQLAIEYDPQPPFDTGSPTKAGAEMADFVKLLLVENEQRVADVIARHGTNRGDRTATGGSDV